MQYHVRMRKSIRDPHERARRLDMLFAIFSRNETGVTDSGQTDTATPAGAAPAEPAQRDNHTTSPGPGQKSQPQLKKNGDL